MVRLARAVIGVGLCFAAVSAFAGTRLEITAASWRPERAELRIEGYSRRVDDVVLLRDADTSQLIGSAAVRGDGKWMLKIRNPTNVPARLRANCGRDTRECAVENR